MLYMCEGKVLMDKGNLGESRRRTNLKHCQGKPQKNEEGRETEPQTGKTPGRGEARTPKKKKPTEEGNEGKTKKRREAQDDQLQGAKRHRGTRNEKERRKPKATDSAQREDAVAEGPEIRPRQKSTQRPKGKKRKHRRRSQTTERSTKQGTVTEEPRDRRQAQKNPGKEEY